MRLLYIKPKQQHDLIKDDSIEIVRFRPTLFKLFYKGERLSMAKIAFRLLYSLLSSRGIWIFCAIKNGTVAHSSVVMTKSLKYPDITEKDYVIGPCETYVEYRGQGLYGYVLKTIMNELGTDDTNFYMIVNENNPSSIRGIEKAGFDLCGSVSTSGIIKKYTFVRK